MRTPGWIIVLFLLQYFSTTAQSPPVDRQLFFLDDNVIDVTLTTDIRKLRNDKKNPAYQPAAITMRFADTMVINAEIGVMPRGVYRKANCDMASLMLDFRGKNSRLGPLKQLKFVGGCHSGSGDEPLVLKEYLAYRIYNLITLMSFRVRLMRVTYKDSKQKAKSYTQYAFLIEDIKDLAKRNNCVEVKKKKFNTEATDRNHINLVSLFQYMIGNTDWSVPVMHNIKLIVPKRDTLVPPYPIPYDFDYAGLVNASYAVPAEDLGTKSVTERVYRGFPRNPPELEKNLAIFKEKKEQVMYYLQNFTLLDAPHRKVMTKYLDDFYKTIENKRAARSAFIDKARRE